MRKLRSTLLIALMMTALAAWAAPRNSAVNAAPSLASTRVQGSVNDAVRTVLQGDVHPLILSGAGQSGVDLGVVEDFLPAGRMLLLLQRSASQEAALKDFIQATHTPGNPAFHQWLTPEEFGRIYGPADSDVAAVTGWLESHGLTVNQIHAGRVAIEFSGTAGQVSEAFQTQIHSYQVNGTAHMANVTDPSVPAALAPVIRGLAPVNDFLPQSHLKILGQAQFDSKTHQATPQWTYPTGGGVNFVMAPGDFATQYDINPVYSAGINGAGQSIAIISESNVDLSLVQAYHTLFGLNASLPQVVVDGTDPGLNGSATEAYLDLEIAGAVAPGATVMMYTSAGTVLTNGLALAAVRAVEDDQASIISVSYGECELELGQSGNAFWSALWQQAAAQGQSVFVSSGDGGSAGCDNFDSQSMAYSGLQINGIASTPYNVAVGGTDFYYSQFATPSAVNAQLSNYWSLSSSTAPVVSLKQYIPEQVWNDFFGFNLYNNGNPATMPIELIVGSGGGASNAALYPSGSGQGYTKPSWQTGTGVPADSVRDIPDVSLFAANGYNFSYYPFCATPGDCSSANLNSNGAVVITGLGGTSVSSPAMAAIQALVNQSIGSRQGQADFIYYPLATQHSTVFHDVTAGGNQVLCYPGSLDCAISSSTATNSVGYYVENGYAAGVGYDQATGLGSVDVAKMIQYWNTVTLTPTTTTLSVSPTSLVHGTATTISGTVARTSGSGTPSGSVSLTGNDGLTHSTSIYDPSLTGGSFYSSVDNLPGGTYQLTANYGGDGTFAASKSAPVTVTVTPENDNLVASGYAWNPYDLYLYPLSSGITLPYGAQIFLDAQPTSVNATIANQPTAATGSVVFTDTLGTLTTNSTQPLNSAGMAEWSTGVFAPGNHTISESYSGDASYNPSTATTAAAFTVIPGSTSLVVKPLVTSVTAGASVAVDVQLTTGYLSLYGAPPSGNVTVTLGGKTATAPWQAFGAPGDASLESVVTFTNVPAGILPVTASYAGDSNWLGSAANGGTVIALSSKLTPTATLATNLVSVASGQTFTLTATVAGVSGKPTPTGTVLFLSDSQSFSVFANLNSGVATIAVPSNQAANGTNVFTAVYQGDANYNSAASNPVNVTVTQSDFSFTTQNPALSISLAGSGTSMLMLTPINGFSGSVTLTVSAPTGITATPATATPAVSASTSDVLTINVAPTMAVGTYPLTITASGGGHVHTAQIQVQVLLVAAPVFSPVAGNYTTPQAVSISDAAAGAVVYYTTNGNAPTSSSTLYTGPITVSAVAETIKAIAFVTGQGPSAVTTAAYTILPLAATPTFSLASGEYKSSQTLTIADTTPGIVIHYTTDGTTPTINSTVYTGPITVWSAVPLTETVQAIATGNGYTASPAFSATYTLMPLVPTPTFTPPAGAYTNAQTVTISTIAPSPTIYYTTDGSAPNTSSPKYTGPITVSMSETVQAFAGSSGYGNSIIASASYTIASSMTAQPTFSLAGGEYKSAQTLIISDTTPGALIHYTSDGTTPTVNSPFYSGPITIWSSVPLTETIQAIATANGYVPSAVTTATYVLMPLVNTPTFSPAPGSYATGQTVTIYDTTPGAIIYYTIDGTAPNTSSPKYNGPISVPGTEVLQAFAGSSGYGNSVIVSGTYTIASSITAAPTFSLASGTYKYAQTLTISDTTPGAIIHYTTDGTTPTASSTVYAGPITVWSTVPVTEVVQAIASTSGYTNSPVTSATYLLMPLVATPTFTPTAGTYTSAQSVIISTTTPNATIYYTIDGTAPSTASTKYTSPITVSASETIQTFAGSPGYGNSLVVSAPYIINSSSGTSIIAPRAPIAPSRPLIGPSPRLSD